MADAPEATTGFLLNHLIAQHLPQRPGERRHSNSDPVTGQAAWYDVRVQLVKCATQEAGSEPRFERAAGIEVTPRPATLRWDAGTRQ